MVQGNPRAHQGRLKMRVEVGVGVPCVNYQLKTALAQPAGEARTIIDDFIVW